MTPWPSDSMSTPPVAPNHAPAHNTNNVGHPLLQEGDSQYNLPTNSTEWSIRYAIRDFYYYLHFGIPFLYRNRVQRVMDAASLSYSDLKLLMALNAENREQRGRMAGDTKAWLRCLDTLKDWEGLTGSFPERSMKLKLNPNPDEVTPLPYVIPLPGTKQSRTSSGGKPALTEALGRFHVEWKTFIKSTSNEWTTLNIVSALMVTYVHKLAQLIYPI